MSDDLDSLTLRLSHVELDLDKLSDVDISEILRI